MKRFEELTKEEILFIIECIQTRNSLHNESGEYDTIVESVINKLN
jgi:hypothetical protein